MTDSVTDKEIDGVRKEEGHTDSPQLETQILDKDYEIYIGCPTLLAQLSNINVKFINNHHPTK